MTPKVPAKARKASSVQPVMPNAVVPAIPLPYVHRRAPPQAIATASTSTSAPDNAEADSPTPRDSNLLSPNQNTVEPTAPTVTGQKNLDSNKLNGKAERKPATRTNLEVVNGRFRSTPLVVGNRADGAAFQIPNAQAEHPNRSVSPQPGQTHTMEHNVGLSHIRQGTHDVQVDKLRHHYLPTSPTRYHMPPSAFQPTRSGGMGESMVPTSHHNMHHPHLSGSSMQFGGHNDSTASSPAPPLSGGYPPPGNPAHQTRGGYPIHTGAGGYPSMAPYGADFVSVIDGYVHPMMPVHINPIDGYPAYMNNYGPSTPHSFHSHSSAPPDDGGPFGPAPQLPTTNGSGVSPEDSRQKSRSGGMHGLPAPRMTLPRAATGSYDAAHAESRHRPDALHEHLANHFQDDTFADCTLELRYSDDRAPPVRIAGHRLLLARSEILKNIITSNNGEPSMSTVLLESEDRYIRSDAFITAVQRLYGMPLFKVPKMPPGADNLPTAGDANARFDFVLGYAAAGHLLGLPAVVVRGIEMACQLLDWGTVEKALEFALGAQPERGAMDYNSVFYYGDPVKGLLQAVATFLITNFPPNFILDVRVADPESYRRLPAVPAPLDGPESEGATGEKGMPETRPDPPVTLPQGRPSRDITHIKFGDLSPAPIQRKQPAPSISDTPRVSHIQIFGQSTALSRILVNLPHFLMKQTLESGGPGNVPGWTTAEVRHRVARDVIAEREKRRARAVDAVVNGRVEVSRVAREKLGGARPGPPGEWDVLGWAETLEPYGNPDMPCISRSWSPLRCGGWGEESEDAHSSYP